MIVLNKKETEEKNVMHIFKAMFPNWNGNTMRYAIRDVDYGRIFVVVSPDDILPLIKKLLKKAKNEASK